MGRNVVTDKVGRNWIRVFLPVVSIEQAIEAGQRLDKLMLKYSVSNDGYALAVRYFYQFMNLEVRLNEAYQLEILRTVPVYIRVWDWDDKEKDKKSYLFKKALLEEFFEANSFSSADHIEAEGILYTKWLCGDWKSQEEQAKDEIRYFNQISH